LLAACLANHNHPSFPSIPFRSLARGGYYKLQVRKGFRILALNTNYCARLNPWSFYDPVDPANQLKWLAAELLEAELNQDKVHIIGHVPPDNRECTQAWLFNFINIVDRFRDTILAQFYGHTHRDEWRVIYSLARPDDPIGVQYIGPSITPFTENNPAYRIYHQNKQGLILDSETYYFNLTEANETPTSEPHWRFSYSTRAHLNMTYGLGPNQWHQYLQRLHEDDEHFDNFYRNFYRYSDVKLGQVCKNKCKYQLLSDLVLMHPYKTKPKPFLANRKTSNHHHRDRHDHHHHHHRRLRSHQE
jgi:sphingomyelin phosphodiesterase